MQPGDVSASSSASAAGAGALAYSGSAARGGRGAAGDLNSASYQKFLADFIDDSPGNSISDGPGRRNLLPSHTRGRPDTPGEDDDGYDDGDGDGDGYDDDDGDGDGDDYGYDDDDGYHEPLAARDAAATAASSPGAAPLGRRATSPLQRFSSLAPARPLKLASAAPAAERMDPFLSTEQPDINSPDLASVVPDCELDDDGAAHASHEASTDYLAGADFRQQVNELDPEEPTQPIPAFVRRSLGLSDGEHVRAAPSGHVRTGDGWADQPHVAFDDAELSRLDHDDPDALTDASHHDESYMSEHPHSPQIDDSRLSADQAGARSHADEHGQEYSYESVSEAQRRLRSPSLANPDFSRVEGITELDLSELEEDLFGSQGQHGPTYASHPYGEYAEDGENDTPLELAESDLPSAMLDQSTAEPRRPSSPAFNNRYFGDANGQQPAARSVAFHEHSDAEALHSSDNGRHDHQDADGEDADAHARFKASISSTSSLRSTHSSNSRHTYEHSTPSQTATAQGTPATTVGSASRVLGSMISQGGGSSYYDLLLETRSECQSLRTLNERLLVANDDFRQTIASLKLERDRAVLDAKSQAEVQIKRVQEFEQQRQDVLRDQIEQLRSELQTAKSAAAQISTIRASIQREKELDVLSIKKDLLALKERQLHDIRAEMLAQREETARRHRVELERERGQFRSELDDLRARLQEALDSRARLAHELEQRPPRSAARDFGQQHDALADERVEWRAREAEFEYVKEQLWILFSDSKTSSPPRSGAPAVSPGTPAKQFSRSTATAPRILEMCRSYVERNEQRMVRMRFDLSAKTEQLQSQQELFRAELQREREQLQAHHQHAIDALKRSHVSELAQQKVSLEASLALVRAEADGNRDRYEARLQQLHTGSAQDPASRQRHDKQTTTPERGAADASLSLQDLAQRFPLQIAKLRSSFEASLARKLVEMEQRHQQALAQLQAQHAQALEQQIAASEAAKAQLAEQHRADIQRVSTRLKEQCSAAYDAAIAKLKGEYLRLEAQLLARFTSEKELYVDRLERKAAAEIAAARESARVQVERDADAKQQAQIAELERMLSEAKRQSLAELKGIKEKYVSTIKRMRDELAARKEDAWRSLETEWVKRRQAMNADWLRRLDNFKAHCEAHHPTCRCTSVVASLRRQNEALLNKAQDGMDARVQSVVAPTASGSRLVVPA